MESSDNLSDSSVCSEESNSGVGTYGSVSKQQANTAKKQIQKEKKKLKEQEKRKAKNKLTSDDIYSKTLEFKTWLLEEKSINLTSLSDSKAKTYFKKFVKKWNDKKLDKKYYRGIDSCSAPQINTQRAISPSLWHTAPLIGPSIPQKPRFAGIHVSSLLINKSNAQPVVNSTQPRSFIQNLGSFINDPENEKYVTLQDTNQPKNDFLDGSTNFPPRTASLDKFGTFGKTVTLGRQRPVLNQVFNSSTLPRTHGSEMALKSQENDVLYSRPTPVPCIEVPCIEVPMSVQSSFINSPNRHPIETHLRNNIDEPTHTYAKVNVNKEQPLSISGDSGLFDMQVEKPISDDTMASRSPPDETSVSRSPLTENRVALDCSPRPSVNFRAKCADPCTSKLVSLCTVKFDQTFEDPFTKSSTLQLLSKNWEAGLDEASKSVTIDDTPHNTIWNRTSGIHYATATVPTFSTYGDPDPLYATPIDAIVDLPGINRNESSDDDAKKQAGDAKEEVVADSLRDKINEGRHKMKTISDHTIESLGDDTKETSSLSSLETNSSFYSNISNCIQNSQSNPISNSNESFTSLKSQEARSNASNSRKNSSESSTRHLSQSSDSSISVHGTKLSSSSDSLTSFKSQASNASTKLSNSSESLTSFKSQASDSSAASMYANSEVFLPNEGEKLAKCVSPFKALEPSQIDQHIAKLNSPRKSKGEASPLRKAMDENLVYVNTNVCNINVYKNQKGGSCSSFKTDTKTDLKPMIVDVKPSESKAKESTPEAVYHNTDIIQQAVNQSNATKALIVHTNMADQNLGNKTTETLYCNTQGLINTQEPTSEIINSDTRFNPSCVNSTAETETSMKTMFNSFGKSEPMIVTHKTAVKEGTACNIEQRERMIHTRDISVCQTQTHASLARTENSEQPKFKPNTIGSPLVINSKPSLKSKHFPNSHEIQPSHCQTIAMETCNKLLNDQRRIQKENIENTSPEGNRKRKILDPLNLSQISNDKPHDYTNKPHKSPKQDNAVQDMIALAKARQEKEKAKIKELLELSRSPRTPTKKKHLLWL
ncbi:unnamed protein product [Owenia fusiformis]|uniref:Uncharacterized protein n=1 Tax=Owenia fusiformis TaxID=6347 RepID=A0A8J1TCL5_OWEFU|nr:unnamed protein product [Owenia fusiformis]